MSQMGRPPKPIEQKRLIGNPGKRPLPSGEHLVILDRAEGVPEPLRELGPSGLQLWTRVWGQGISWVSPDVDVDLLMMTCESMDERTDLMRLVASEGESRDRRALRALNSEIISNLSLLGFTPADRSRLGVAEVKARSKLEELLARSDS
jgi:hypothetical protein